MPDSKRATCLLASRAEVGRRGGTNLRGLLNDFDTDAVLVCVLPPHSGQEERRAYQGLEAC